MRIILTIIAIIIAVPSFANPLILECTGEIHKEVYEVEAGSYNGIVYTKDLIKDEKKTDSFVISYGNDLVEAKGAISLRGYRTDQYNTADHEIYFTFSHDEQEINAFMSKNGTLQLSDGSHVWDKYGRYSSEAGVYVSRIDGSFNAHDSFIMRGETNATDLLIFERMQGFCKVKKQLF